MSIFFDDNGDKFKGSVHWTKRIGDTTDLGIKGLSRFRLTKVLRDRDRRLVWVKRVIRL